LGVGVGGLGVVWVGGVGGGEKRGEGVGGGCVGWGVRGGGRGVKGGSK